MNSFNCNQRGGGVNASLARHMRISWPTSFNGSWLAVYVSPSPASRGPPPPPRRRRRCISGLHLRRPRPTCPPAGAARNDTDKPSALFTHASAPPPNDQVRRMHRAPPEHASLPIVARTARRSANTSCARSINSFYFLPLEQLSRRRAAFDAASSLWRSRGSPCRCPALSGGII